MKGGWASTAVLIGLAVTALRAQSTPESPPEDAEEPREIGLVERATGRLAQIDVTVTGPRDATVGLTVDDFELVVGGRFIEEFLVDGICAPDDIVGEEPGESAVEAGEAPILAQAVSRIAPVTYLFYFDQHNLRMSGRQNSLDITRRLIPELIVNGNRAMIVSAGERLATFADLTEDQQALQDALDRIERDRRQWDQYPSLEEVRIDEILRELSNDTTRALSLARMHQREETYRMDRSLRLLSMVVGRLAAVDPPKAVIYFADTMRRNAGEHYLSYFGQSHRAASTSQALVSAMENEVFMGTAAFDRVVEEAAAHGVRLYTVQAEGLVGASSMVRGGSRAPSITTRRVSDAQDSLSSLALESGGQAFLNGVPAPKIARRIQQDLDCVYLLSFDPTGLPEDDPLPVVVRVKLPDVRAQARGTIVLQSESARVTSELMAAFVSPEVVRTGWEIRAVIVPTGFEGGLFHSLVQIAVPAFPLSDAEWDLGFSVVARDRVREEGSSRISIDTPGLPVVLEKKLTFKPGPYEIIMVARELHSGQIATARVDGAWPDLREGRAAIGPIAVLQPSPGAFLRDGEIRTRGALGRSDRELALTSLPTLVVSLVCRSGGAGSSMRVERKIAGETAAMFPRIDLDLDEDQCAQIRDRIPRGMMTAGGFTYEIRVLDGDEELASASAAFGATAPDPPPRIPVSDGDGP